jgi:sugar phosphate isomerase/epimerase
VQGDEIICHAADSGITGAFEPPWAAERREVMNTLQLAIATDFAGEFPQIEKISEMLYKVAQAGFTHIHWCSEWDGDYIYSSYEMEQIKEWMDQYGLKAKALHATKGSRRNVNLIDGHYRKDYTSDVEYNRKAGVELIKNRVDLAACIGAKEIVLHLYVPHFTLRGKPEAEEHFYRQVYQSFDELQPYCEHMGVAICIENLFDMPERYELDQLDRLFCQVSGRICWLLPGYGACEYGMGQ